MPQPQQARSAKAAAKRKEWDEKELRHRVRPGINAKLAELMAWHGITEQAEAVQLLILNAHALGPKHPPPPSPYRATKSAYRKTWSGASKKRASGSCGGIRGISNQILRVSILCS